MRIECRVHFSVATFVGVDTMSSMNAGLPSTDEMYSAVANSDSRYDGVFFVAVKSTGIFCRPGCTARTPLRKNVQFFAKTADALAVGFSTLQALPSLGDHRSDAGLVITRDGLFGPR